MKIQPAQGRLEVDQKATLASVNLGDPGQVMRKAAASGQKAALQATAKFAQEGNLMMNQPNIIPKLAENTWKEPQFGMGSLPKSPPRVEYQGQPEPEIKIQPTWPKVTAQVQAPAIDVTPTMVKAYLKQRHAVSIEYKDGAQI